MVPAANSESFRGRFNVIDSFAIPRRNEFYLIGQIVEGTLQEGWYARIPLNGTLALPMKIKRIEYARKAREEYPVLVIAVDAEEVDFLLSLSIGSEPIIISTEGPE
ncbi:hypothetical protein [Hymenobacter yonginensis]|uniref:Uncharacterized protein n=1 Tax=Hymenobacter yonginensis TaxID=748197 RepID=A0ABY7PM06_9BACT|nr:hypothetical protein [Hymenobacter yonginensis]WBO83729.1 hypothetical protein O9Z63_15270 [Hymenobacter yonginensis]